MFGVPNHAHPDCAVAGTVEGNGATPSASLPLSVIITAYRRRSFLREAVESTLDQTLPRSQYEILVIKDWVDAEMDPWLRQNSVRVIHDEEPRVGGMLATGIAQARGDVISFLDDDDR
ncbi:glycosyltransferase, partial [mine drainage metagenome]